MVSINIDLSDDLRADAARLADSQGVSLEDFVRNCVLATLRQNIEAAGPEADAAHIEYMRRGLEKAEREIAEGLGKPWDREAIRREGMKRLARNEVDSP